MNTYPLKAVTVLQPYASAIAAGVKPWENRPRPIRLDDGPIWLALHAGLKLYPSAEIYQRAYRKSGVWPDAPDLAALPMGAILGVMRIDDCQPIAKVRDPWACGPFCWRVGEVRLLPRPVPCKGSQGFWALWNTRAAAEGRASPSGLSAEVVGELHALTRQWSTGRPPCDGFYDFEGIGERRYSRPCDPAAPAPRWRVLGPETAFEVTA